MSTTTVSVEPWMTVDRLRQARRDVYLTALESYRLDPTPDNAVRLADAKRAWAALGGTT